MIQIVHPPSKTLDPPLVITNTLADIGHLFPNSSWHDWIIGIKCPLEYLQVYRRSPLFLYFIYVTISAKTCIVRTNMYVKKKQFKSYLWKYACYLQGLMGPAFSKRSFKSIPSYLPGYGEFENLCFVSMAWIMSVSHAFVYNAVDINKIATAFLAKLPP